MQALIRFVRCIQDSQELGSDDEHMVSRVFFEIHTSDAVYTNLHCDVKQAVGESFENAPLEVGRPRGYDGSLDYAPFREAVENYYRSLVGSTGRGIHIQGGSNIRMRNNTFEMPAETQVTYSADSLGW